MLLAQYLPSLLDLRTLILLVHGPFVLPHSPELLYRASRSYSPVTLRIYPCPVSLDPTLTLRASPWVGSSTPAALLSSLCFHARSLRLSASFLPSGMGFYPPFSPLYLGVSPATRMTTARDRQSLRLLAPTMPTGRRGTLLGSTSCRSFTPSPARSLLPLPPSLPPLLGFPSLWPLSAFGGSCFAARLGLLAGYAAALSAKSSLGPGRVGSRDPWLARLRHCPSRLGAQSAPPPRVCAPTVLSGVWTPPAQGKNPSKHLHV